MAGTAASGQPQLSTEELQNLMLPPLGWKVDQEVMKAHFWQTRTVGDDPPGEPSLFIVYPFWPAFFELGVENGQVKDRMLRSFGYNLSELLSDAQESPDAAIRRKSALWLRQNLVLCFAGFRLSKIGGQRPYAPWIKPEDAQRLDQMADAYVAGQKLMRIGKAQKEISALQVTEWITHPHSTTLTDIVSYYDMLQASDASIAVDHIYPVRWVWGREKGNLTMRASTTIDSDLLDAYAYRLIPGTLPASSDPVCLWLRDVLLSYIAGKELLEGKRLRLKDKEDEPLLQKALRQWWAALEEQQQSKESPAKSGAATKKD